MRPAHQRATMQQDVEDMLLLLLACTGKEPQDSTGGEDTSPPTAYLVNWWTNPTPPVATQEAEFGFQITDEAGQAIDDLQQSHERMVHVLFISTDLSSFQHVHHEDYNTLTADDLRNSTFGFPLTLPMGGDYRLVFDYAHRNQYLQTADWISASGTPAQAAIVEDFVTEREQDGLKLSLSWDVAPVAGYEASFTLNITEADGTDVTDIVQYLGADGHAVIADSALANVGHTHAWFPGMENVAPGHDMPHTYSGPNLPFHYTCPTAGLYKTWIQFTRESTPDTVYTVPFMFEVAP